MCVCVCVCVSVYVCVCVCVSATALTACPILMKIHTNTFNDVFLCHFSHILKIRLDDVITAILYKNRYGTLTSSILLRFSSYFSKM